jgi:hypothetical protein
MEGRYPSFVRIGLNECADPARRQEFNDWYNRTHLNDVVASGWATHALRYQRADGTEEPGDHLAIYELVGSDLDAALAIMARAGQQWVQEGRIHPSLKSVGRGNWRSTQGRFTTAKSAPGHASGIMMLQCRCRDANREADLARWYETTHIPDILETGLFHSAYRFDAASQEPGQGTSAVIYETDLDPADARRRLREEHSARLAAAGRMSDLLEITWRGVFRMVAHVP